eukprot:g3638.t1
MGILSLFPILTKYVFFLKHALVTVPLLVLLFPAYVLFFPEWATRHSWHEGAFPAQVPVIFSHPELAARLDEKAEWWRLFAEFRVPQPEVLGLVFAQNEEEHAGRALTDGECLCVLGTTRNTADEQEVLNDHRRETTTVRPQTMQLCATEFSSSLDGSNKEVVVKPNVGTFGIGVRMTTIADIERKFARCQKAPPKRAPAPERSLALKYLVQERVRDAALPAVARSYRLTTMMDVETGMARPLGLLEVSDAQQDVSNRGTVEVLADEEEEFLAQKKLQKFAAVTQKLLQLHGAALATVPAIGWDLVESKERGRVEVLEGNVGAGLCWGQTVAASCDKLLGRADALYRRFYAGGVGVGLGAKEIFAVAVANALCVFLAGLGLRLARSCVSLFVCSGVLALRATRTFLGKKGDSVKKGGPIRGDVEMNVKVPVE